MNCASVFDRSKSQMGRTRLVMVHRRLKEHATGCMTPQDMYTFTCLRTYLCGKCDRCTCRVSSLKSRKQWTQGSRNCQSASIFDKNKCHVERTRLVMVHGQLKEHATGSMTPRVMYTFTCLSIYRYTRCGKCDRCTCRVSSLKSIEDS